MPRNPIVYCRNCVMPETKPDLQIMEDGVCNACHNFRARREVDWEGRKGELLSIVERYRTEDGSNYDCIVPVSGGKDSTYQVMRMLELGMNPLCVTAETCHLTELGRRNIENLKGLGVDYIQVSTNPKVRHKINALSLRQVGDISWPEHVTIFTIPVRLAVQLNIPLIVWGENSQHEYGGPAAAAENNVLNRRWLEEFGGMLGMRVSDLIGQDGIQARDLIQYTYPSDEELSRVGVTGIFLGYYIPWDGYSNALIAQAAGFESYHKPAEGSFVSYENLDNAQSHVHDYFKFLKYGFARATDQACVHIRRGRLPRSLAIDLVREREGYFPWEYLGVTLPELLDPLGMSVEEFTAICDRFTNKKLFVQDARGNLKKDARGNLTKINYDNVGEAAAR